MIWDRYGVLCGYRKQDGLQGVVGGAMMVDVNAMWEWGRSGKGDISRGRGEADRDYARCVL